MSRFCYECLTCEDRFLARGSGGQRRTEIRVHGQDPIGPDQPQDPEHGDGTDRQPQLSTTRAGLVKSKKQAAHPGTVTERRHGQIRDDDGHAGNDGGEQQLTDGPRVNGIDIGRQHHDGRPGVQDHLLTTSPAEGRLGRHARRGRVWTGLGMARIGRKQASADKSIVLPAAREVQLCGGWRRAGRRRADEGGVPAPLLPAPAFGVKGVRVPLLPFLYGPWGEIADQDAGAAISGINGYLRLLAWEVRCFREGMGPHSSDGIQIGP
jgi:hypothetical protein